MGEWLGNVHGGVTANVEEIPFNKKTMADCYLVQTSHKYCPMTPPARDHKDKQTT